MKISLKHRVVDILISKNMTICAKRSLVHAALIVVVMTIFTILVTFRLTSQMDSREESELNHQVSLLVNSMSSYHSALVEGAERMSAVFVKSFREPFESDPKQTIRIGNVETPVLRTGRDVLNLNNTPVDRFTAVTNAVASVFVRSGNDFVRVATSLEKEDGTRAIGTVLERNHPAYQGLLKGEPFTGKVKLFSKDYMTKYVPVRNNAGQVIAVLFIGLDFTDNLQVLKQQIRNSRIYKSGYFYAFDSSDRAERGVMQIHPSLEGTNVLNYRDTNGREIVREMLQKNEGTIRYAWINRETGETSPREKLVVFRHLKEWDWIVAGGAPLDEVRAAGRSVMKAMIGAASLASLILVVLSVSLGRLERKLTAEREESERRYRELFQAMQNGFALHEIICDAAGNPNDYRFLEVNQAFEDMTGLKGADVVGRTVREVLPGIEPLWIERYGRVALNGESRHFESYSADLHRYYEVNAYSPQPGRFATIIQDVTQRRLAEDALRKKNVEFEQFTHTVTHDMKSPLVTIKTFIGYLEQDLASGDGQRVQQDLDFIRSAAGKMERQLFELLELSRVGRVVNSPVAIRYQDLVDEALAAVAGSLAERHVTVTRGGEQIILNGDRPRLSEVWQNLIENAVKYLGSQEAPRIDIGMELRDGERVFYVRDNGIGIEPALADQVFDLFVKLNPDSSGSGLGLALVRRIVEVHGGRIWVESRGAGEGSTFCFTFGEEVFRAQQSDDPLHQYGGVQSPEKSVSPHHSI